MIVVFSSLSSAFLFRSRFGFYGASKGCRESLSRCFFLPITLARKEEFAGNALQNSGTGATAYIRTDKTYAVTVRRARREKPAALAAIKKGKAVRKGNGWWRGIRVGNYKRYDKGQNAEI